MDVSGLDVAFRLVGDPFILFLIVAGTIGGVLVGALPGLSSPMAVALLLPILRMATAGLRG